MDNRGNIKPLSEFPPEEREEAAERLKQHLLDETALRDSEREAGATAPDDEEES